MKKYAHVEQSLGVPQKEWGNIYAVIAPLDSSSLLLLTQSGNPSNPGIERLIFNNRMVAEWEFGQEQVKFALSPDGAKLATARYRIKDGKLDGYDIFINGEKKYECNLRTIHYFDWISNEALMWDGWLDDWLNDESEGIPKQSRGGGIRYFRNGEETTGRFEYQPFLWGDMYQGFWITDYENDKSYQIFDDGRIVEQGRAMRFLDFRPERGKEKSEQPKENWNEKGKSVQVSYRGVYGPSFHDIESGGGMRQYVFSDDGLRLGYCGIRYSASANAVGKIVGNIFDFVEEKRVISWLVGWPLAILFNPYFGIGHAFIENSKRWTPVNHPAPWKKKYRWAKACFFTDKNELVVWLGDSKGYFVVIDEDEGPSFDSIVNIRYVKSEEKVYYIGRRGNEFYRVSVCFSDS